MTTPSTPGSVNPVSMPAPYRVNPVMDSFVRMDSAVRWIEGYGSQLGQYGPGMYFVGNQLVAYEDGSDPAPLPSFPSVQFPTLLPSITWGDSQYFNDPWYQQFPILRGWNVPYMAVAITLGEAVWVQNDITGATLFFIGSGGDELVHPNSEWGPLNDPLIMLTWQNGDFVLQCGDQSYTYDQYDMEWDAADNNLLPFQVFGWSIKPRRYNGQDPYGPDDVSYYDFQPYLNGRPVGDVMQVDTSAIFNYISTDYNPDGDPPGSPLAPTFTPVFIGFGSIPQYGDQAEFVAHRLYVGTEDNAQLDSNMAWMRYGTAVAGTSLQYPPD